MKDMSRLIHNADRPGTEYPGFFYQPPHHNAVSRQEIIHRIRIQFIQPFIDLISIFYFSNILWRR